MIALSLFSIGRFTTLTNHSNAVSHSNKVIRTLYRAEVYFKDVDRWERGYILANDTGYIRAINGASDSLVQMLDSLDALLSDNAVQSRNMIDLRETIGSRIRSLHENFSYIDTSHAKEASPYYFEGRKLTVNANRLFRVMHATEIRLLKERQDKQVFYQKLTTSTIKTLLAIFCMITLFLFLLLMRLMRAGILYQERLQAKIIDLERSHSELQDIAYSISHDLQEPLRKIQVFSNMLIVRKSNSAEDDGTKDTLTRIYGSANRMRSLIADLESLTNLTRIDEQKASVNLNTIIEQVVSDMNDTIKENNAVVRVEDLPTITCYGSQMTILFRALMDNALKFVKEDTKPEIYVSYRIVPESELADGGRPMPNQQFHCISIADNGIGFDNRHISDIFRMFRRLHTEGSRYEGKGVGLAICQRIMANHEGYIRGEGVPDKGATFKLYFPV
ncbi:sensor histidine kinase [Nemorincola caseinilytica]